MTGFPGIMTTENVTFRAEVLCHRGSVLLYARSKSKQTSLPLQVQLPETGQASFNSVLSFGFGGTNACATAQALEGLEGFSFSTFGKANPDVLMPIGRSTLEKITFSGLGGEPDDFKRCWNQQGETRLTRSFTLCRGCLLMSSDFNMIVYY